MQTLKTFTLIRVKYMVILQYFSLKIIKVLKIIIYLPFLDSKNQKNKFLKKGFIYEKNNAISNLDYTDSTFLRIDRNNSRISVSDLLIKHLDNHNITNVFSVINDSNIHLIDSILQNKNFKIKFFNSPDNCIYAALGYSNYTNDIPLIVFT